MLSFSVGLVSEADQRGWTCAVRSRGIELGRLGKPSHLASCTSLEAILRGQKNTGYFYWLLDYWMIFFDSVVLRLFVDRNSLNFRARPSEKLHNMSNKESAEDKMERVSAQIDKSIFK
jgi:hypothetical protein